MKFGIKDLLTLFIAVGFFANAYSINQRASELELATSEAPKNHYFYSELSESQILQELSYYKHSHARRASMVAEMEECHRQLVKAVKVRPARGKVGIVGVPTLQDSATFTHAWHICLPEDCTGQVEVRFEDVVEKCIAELKPGVNQLRCHLENKTMSLFLDDRVFEMPISLRSETRFVDEVLIQKDFEIPSDRPLDIEL